LAKSTSGKPSVLIRRASATLAVAVYANDSPTDEDWGGYLEVMRSLEHGYRMVIFSSGGGPTTMQRRDLESITEGQETARVAVITSSRLARGIVTAIRWFNRDIKAFEPAHRDAAFTFLALDKVERDDVLRLAKSMATELGVAEQLMLTG
jgi:hypothetical protein